MATTKATTKALQLDLTTPLYVSVGAADLAVEKLRKAAEDLQVQLGEARTRLGSVDRDPKALAGLVGAGLDALVKDAKEAQAKVESRVAAVQGELSTDVRALPKQAEARLAELQAEARSLVAELATRGSNRIATLRDSSISGDVDLLEDTMEVVKAVSGDVEAAAAEAAKDAEAAARVDAPVAEVAEAAEAAVTAPATKAPARRKAPARKKPTA